MSIVHSTGRKMKVRSQKVTSPRIWSVLKRPKKRLGSTGSWYSLWPLADFCFLKYWIKVNSSQIICLCFILKVIIVRYFLVSSTWTNPLQSLSESWVTETSLLKNSTKDVVLWLYRQHPFWGLLLHPSCAVMLLQEISLFLGSLPQDVTSLVLL